MSRRYFIWILLAATACLLLIIGSMWETAIPREALAPEKKIVHPLTPFKSYISAAGVIEASSDNISIGTPINRIVEKVFVQPGTNVKKGEALFKLEDEDLKVDLQARELAYQVALARLHKLQLLPRPEDTMAAEAAVKKADVQWTEAKNQYDMVQGLENSRALSLQEINRRRFNLEQAEAQLDQAKADLAKVKEGAWKPDLAIAELETQQAKTNIAKIEAEMQRTIIRSPIDGVVLQVKVHEGELPSSVSTKGPLMIVGDTDEMYLKVSINQFEAPYFRKEAPAVAYLRGNAMVKFSLEFVRLEPYLVNKQNFTNEITEKVDTRVLQVIYKIDKASQNIFVGQQMDAYIDAEFPK